MKHHPYVLTLWATLALCSVLAGPRARAEANIVVVGDLAQRMILLPGGSLEGSIILRNTGDQPGEVKLYQTDYAYEAGGKRDYAEAGTLPRSNAGWITYTPHQTVIGPCETCTVYYTIHVPQDTALIGSYWSLMMVEPFVPEVMSPSAEDDKIAVAVRNVVRFGVLMLTNIGNTGKRDLRLTNEQLVLDNGTKIFKADLENCGERNLILQVWLEPFGANGVSLGRFPACKVGVLPGCTESYQFDLTPCLASGSYTALLIADNGDQYVFGKRVELQVP